MPFDDVPHRIRTMDSHDQQAFDWLAPKPMVSRALVRWVYAAAGLIVLAVIWAL